MNKGFILILLVSLAIANVAYGLGYKEVVVPASESDWLPTGILFKSGEMLNITADPDFKIYARDGKYTSDPEGLGNIQAPKDSPLPGSSFLSLVGKIGSETFFVGLSISKKIATSGELYLSVNDSMREEVRKDNWGFFKTSINQGTGQPPVILKAGFENSLLSSINGGLLTIAAQLYDPDGLNDIASVEILIDSKATGIELKPRGNIWSLEIPIEPGFAGSFMIQLQAADRSGLKSDIWPYITIH